MNFFRSCSFSLFVNKNNKLSHLFTASVESVASKKKILSNISIKSHYFSTESTSKSTAQSTNNKSRKEKKLERTNQKQNIQAKPDESSSSADIFTIVSEKISKTNVTQQQQKTLQQKQQKKYTNYTIRKRAPDEAWAHLVGMR